MSEVLRTSHSHSDLFASCPRKYLLKCIEGIYPVEEDYKLRFGNVFHSALEAWWKTPNPGRLDAAFKAWNTACSRRGLSPEECITGTYLLTAYDALQQKEFGEILAEHRVTVPLMGPNGPDPELELKCIFDTILVEHGFAIEHKTTAQDISQGSVFWERAKGQQLDVYFIVAEEVGIELKYVLWDVVKVPGFRLFKTTPEEDRYYKVNCKGGAKGELKKGAREHDETLEEFEERVRSEILEHPEQYFQQRRMYRDEVSIEQTRYDLWANGRQMLNAIREEAFPRNRQSCGAYGRKCEYYPICFEGADPQQSQLYRVKRPPHPLRKG